MFFPPSSASKPTPITPTMLGLTCGFRCSRLRTISTAPVGDVFPCSAPCGLLDLRSSDHSRSPWTCRYIWDSRGLFFLQVYRGTDHDRWILYPTAPWPWSMGACLFPWSRVLFCLMKFGFKIFISNSRSTLRAIYLDDEIHEKNLFPEL